MSRHRSPGGARRCVGSGAADPRHTLRHPIRDLDPHLSTYLNVSIALIGDAARAITPDHGSGAGEALVEAYDHARRPPTRRAVLRSRRSMQVATAPHSRLPNGTVPVASPLVRSTGIQHRVASEMADIHAGERTPEPPRTGDPHDGHLANVVGMLALDVMTQVSFAVETATGLSMVQATALSALAIYAEGGSVDQLRRSVDLSHSAAVRLVDRLVQRGLVRRRADAGDHRVAAVHLTARGRRCVAEIRVARLNVLRHVVGRLAYAQRDLLAGILDVLAASETAQPPPMGRAEYLCRLCEPDACGHPDNCPVTRQLPRHPTSARG